MDVTSESSAVTFCLREPVRVMDGLNVPYSIVFTSDGNVIVSEKFADQISIFDIKGKIIGKFGSHDDSSKLIKIPQGLAIDDDDNVYVSSVDKVLKFTSSGKCSGKFIKHVGDKLGSGEGEFNDPYGMTLYDSQLYVCDCNNDRIQVFNRDLQFICSYYGEGSGKFRKPYDV